MFNSFSFSYSPTDVGEWGWVVYYDGKRTDGLVYNGAYGEWNPFTVNSHVESPSDGNGTEPPPPPPDEGIPVEYIYVAVAVIVIVIVALVAYFLLKK